CLAGRFSLPSSANLFGICRSGGGAFRPMGRRLDDIGAASALPAMGNVGAGFRAAGVAGKIALVYAVALRPMAGHQYVAVDRSMIPKSLSRKRSCSKIYSRVRKNRHAYLHSYAASEQQE